MFQMMIEDQKEICTMSHTDCSTFTDELMCTKFPALNKFFFLTFDGLCLANHYQARVMSVVVNPIPDHQVYPNTDSPCH